jgi:hypothetical protein
MRHGTHGAILTIHTLIHGVLDISMQFEGVASRDGAEGALWWEQGRALSVLGVAGGTLVSASCGHLAPVASVVMICVLAVCLGAR